MRHDRSSARPFGLWDFPVHCSLALLSALSALSALSGLPGPPGRFPRRASVRDTVGVGDAFCVGYLPGLLDGLSPDRRLDRTDTLVRSHTPSPGRSAGCPGNRVTPQSPGNSGAGHRGRAPPCTSVTVPGAPGGPRQ